MTTRSPPGLRTRTSSANGGLAVREMLQNLGTDDDVETAVGDRGVATISALGDDPPSRFFPRHQGEEPLRLAQIVPVEIHARDFDARRPKGLAEMPSAPAAGVEDAHSRFQAGSR